MMGTLGPKFVDEIADGCGERGGIGRSVGEQGEAGEPVLAEREIDGGSGRFSKEDVFYAPGDTDDFQHLARTAEPLADGILPRPEASGKQVVHDGDARCRAIIIAGESAAADERDADRLKVSTVISHSKRQMGSRRRRALNNSSISPPHSARKPAG